MAAGRCTAAYITDEYHGYGCSITEGPCMFLYPNSKSCAEEYGEGPDAIDDEDLRPDPETPEWQEHIMKRFCEVE